MNEVNKENVDYNDLESSYSKIRYATANGRYTHTEFTMEL